MTTNENTQPRLRDLSKAFAKRIVKLNQYLNHQMEPREEILSHNVTQCGTRIGSTILKAEMSGSNEGFRQGISKALDEATETQYWLELLGESGYLTEEQSKSINDDLRHILNILWKIVKAKKRAEATPQQESQTESKTEPQTKTVTIVDPATDMPIVCGQTDGEMGPEEQALFEQLERQCKKRGRKPKHIMAEAGMAFMLVLLMSFGFLTTGCYQTAEDDAIENVDPNNQLVDVTVSFTGLEITQSESRASDKTASEAGVKNVVLKAFDSNGTAVATFVQAAGNEGFGNLSLKLAVGKYAFVAVANGGSNAPTLTSATSASLSETSNPTLYTCVMSDVTISGNSSQTVNMDMGKKKNAQFRIKITDGTPADVKAIQLVVNPSASAPTALAFSPATGLASTDYKYERNIALADYNISSLTNVVIGNNLLLTAAEQQISVTINALSASNEVLYTRTLEDVPFKQSQTTTATGTFFSAGTTGAFSFDTTMEDNEVNLDPE